MNLTELKAQIAVGTIRTAAQIETMIKISEDVEILQWASTHSREAVRRASLSHKNCPFGCLMRAVVFDASNNIRDAARKNIIKNYNSYLHQLFIIIENFPQLSFPFEDLQVLPESTTLQTYQKKVYGVINKKIIQQIAKDRKILREAENYDDIFKDCPF